MSKLLENVVTELAKLPGVGRRTALRLALHLLKQEVEDVDLFAGSIYQFRRDIRWCRQCRNLSDEELCPICSDPKRDHSTICVVEQVGDLISIENTRQYNGLYHVLGGVISPIQGISPSDLHVDLLLDNIRRLGVKEVILALGTTIEGETTSYYLTKKLQPLGVVVSVISRGIGFGDELEYADELTITHALRNRKPI
ncbi:MAG TPA: recombination mediator RecR [Candidatus Rikenella faecigallinarum]|uniref:Recombination protein RecR n=1 Tax=Candidatus Rikenella faecigallinarum TaxID=2838745 RepID=A0A9D1TXY8_9BACT|nr:recombination mediator RecR [Candidatus Rikenella faecigallinarum]